MNCYPEMDRKIVELLELREDAISLYAAQRIRDLERVLTKREGILDHASGEAEQRLRAQHRG